MNKLNQEKTTAALAGELAKATGIDSKAALKLLNTLGLEKLLRNVDLTNQVLADKGARNTFGVPESEPRTSLALADLKLATCRQSRFHQVVA